ncbi:xanthine dehydrogenase family protein molybdopterin-binding subunit, partial [Acidobacteria bacterium AH-259-D05]|nr:xanthine dehydrogenase family protein molybdopterin-binding subunit [Acidobacteria bacterium AH-259-D05]
VTKNWVGKSTPRKEDVRHLKGEATFVDDLDMECYHAALLGSPYAHARIKNIDTSRAEQLKGVVAVLTGQEVAEKTQPITPRAITKPVTQYAMAVDRVRYVGELVAVVVAENDYVAEDALELIDVEYEPLTPVVHIADALNEESPLIFEEAGSNVLLHDVMEHGSLENAYQEADLIVKEKFHISRYSSTPLETWGIIVKYERASDSFVVWSNDQQHGRSLVNVCHTLGISTDKLRLIVPDIGGSFGIKLALWPYIAIVSLLARKVDKPVKWMQTRTAHLTAGSHAPDAELEIELAVRKDGRILGLSLKDIENDGSFIHTAGIYALIKFATMVGCYTIEATRAELRTVVTNRGPTVQNRGVGKPAMIFVLERMVDLVAKKLGLDPAEMRFRNFVQPEQMPYTTPSGEIYESGDYPECLRKALDLIQYEELKERREDMRKKGRYWGIGISAGIEPGTSNLGYYYTSRGTPEYTGNAEGAMVTIDFDGNVNVLLGSVDSGQGHATTTAQVAADMLGISPDRVSVNTQMDSLVAPFLGHSGVYSNKFNDVDLGAVIMATKKVRDKMFRIAAHILKVKEAELELKDGGIRASQHPDTGVSFREIAAVAYKRILLLPEGMEPGLKEIAYYKSPYAKLPSRKDFNVQLTHSNSVHAVVVEVDVETGMVKFHRYIIVHDCGNQINPGVVEGMAIGSTVHGVGASLYEEFLYGEDGQLLSNTFIDYLKPTAVGLPRFEITHMASPCPYTLLGSKAVGEGGSITSLAAIANAVEDALSPFQVKVMALPITPEKVLRAVRETKEIGAR